MGSRMSKKKHRINRNRPTGLKLETNEKYENPFRPIKIGLLGDIRVGKTAICNSLIGMEFQNEYLQTIGCDKYEKV